MPGIAGSTTRALNQIQEVPEHLREKARSLFFVYETLEIWNITNAVALPMIVVGVAVLSYFLVQGFDNFWVATFLFPFMFCTTPLLISIYINTVAVPARKRIDALLQKLLLEDDRFLAAHWELQKVHTGYKEFCESRSLFPCPSD